MPNNMHLFNPREDNPVDFLDQVNQSIAPESANQSSKEIDENNIENFDDSKEISIISNSQNNQTLDRKDYETQVKQPDATMAQANTQANREQMSAIEQELNYMQSSIMELHSLAREQGLLTEDEIQNIIIPLSQEIDRLLGALSSTDDFREGSEPEPTEIETSQDVKNRIQNDPYRVREVQEPGPKRQVGSAERELVYPSSNFSENKSETSGNVQKVGIIPIGTGTGRGWKGDPEGHAESARERWAMEGVPPGGKLREVKPREQRIQEGALVIPKAVREVAVKTAQRAGRSLARSAGDTIADLGMQAFGTVAGIILFRYLSGQSTGVSALIRLGTVGLKQALIRSFQLRRIDGLSRKVKLASLVRMWAEKK
jgi:hypothetical protein